MAFGSFGISLHAQEEYKVYAEPPRLLLKPQRLRLLRRERERESPRWQHLNTLISGKAQMPEPGFALALLLSGFAGQDYRPARRFSGLTSAGGHRCKTARARL